jgi:hypothetical protein
MRLNKIITWFQIQQHFTSVVSMQKQKRTDERRPTSFMLWDTTITES